jgi:hypothetical protein
VLNDTLQPGSAQNLLLQAGHARIQILSDNGLDHTVWNPLALDQHQSVGLKAVGQHQRNAKQERGTNERWYDNQDFSPAPNGQVIVPPEGSMSNHESFSSFLYLRLRLCLFDI